MPANPLDAFLQQYSLASHEGVLLMCLAEALLRIPDAATADALIADKVGGGEWARHVGDSSSLLVNASTWGLLLTGRFVALQPERLGAPAGWLAALAGRVGDPVVRAALRQAMRILGRQFVMGRDIGEALQRASEDDERSYRRSYDMLGEAALTAADAKRYLDLYRTAIAAIGRSATRDGTSHGDVHARPGISVKLSALHPRYEPAQERRVLAELVPRLAVLVNDARQAGIALTVDAEEAQRLELSLRIIDAVIGGGACQGYDGFGLAVQAYQKRAPHVIERLAARATQLSIRLTVRLVKGAYWDSEIKRAQEQGLAGFPVFTRKASTDVSYLACLRRLAAAGTRLYPQVATHNAHTVAYALEVLRGVPFEFQRLHGMGTALYEQLVPLHPCRVYAPVGAHEDLLPYLVRRLLENGANSSFVNRIVDENLAAADVVRDPVAEVDALLTSGAPAADPRIAAPAQLYGASRRNSRGVNLADPDDVAALRAELATGLDTWNAQPLLADDAPGVRRRARAALSPVSGAQLGLIVDAAARDVPAPWPLPRPRNRSGMHRASRRAPTASSVLPISSSAIAPL